MDAVIYARYSSSAQREESIEQQIESCRKFAVSNKLTVVDVYSDEAISGRTDSRPQFQHMLRDAEKHKFEAVIAYKSNRIARNMLNALQYEDKLAKLGIQTFYAQEEFGNTAAGRFALRNMMNLNQFYSENMAEDIKRGLRDNAERGLANGPIPYGYRRGSDGQYVIVPEEADVVRNIFKEFAEGTELATIARELNAKDIKTKRGGEWNKNSFHRVLSNERYIGVYQYMDVRIEDSIPPIIDKDLFNRCQHQLKLPRRGKRAGGDNAEYLLSGKLFCGKCGSRYKGVSSTSKSGAKHHYYMCNNGDSERVRKDFIEEFVTKIASDFVLTDEMIESMAAATEQYQNRKNNMDLLTTQITEKEKALERCVDMVCEGLGTKALHARMVTLESDIDRLKEELARIASVPEFNRDDFAAALHQYAGGDCKDKTYQKLIISSFVKKVVINGTELEIHFHSGIEPCATKVDVGPLVSYRCTPYYISIVDDVIIVRAEMKKALP